MLIPPDPAAVPWGLRQPCCPVLPRQCLHGTQAVTLWGHHTGARASSCARLAAMQGVALVCAEVLPCLRARRAGTSSHLNGPASGSSFAHHHLMAGALPKTPITEEDRRPLRIFLSCLGSGAVLLQHLRRTASPQCLFYFYFFLFFNRTPRCTLNSHALG